MKIYISLPDTRVIVFIISQPGGELFSLLQPVLRNSSMESVCVLVKAAIATVGCSEPVMAYSIGVGAMLIFTNL